MSLPRVSSVRQPGLRAPILFVCCLVLLWLMPNLSMAEETSSSDEDILVPTTGDSLNQEPDTAAVVSTLLVEHGDGRSERLEKLTDHLDAKFGRLDYLVWDLDGSLSWDPSTLRGRLTWDSLSVSFAVGSRVVHSGERVLTMSSPMSFADGAVLYPHPDFLDVLSAVDARRLRFVDRTGTLTCLPPEPWIRELTQREVGHRFEIRCTLPEEPESRLRWNGRGALRVELDGVWGVRQDLPASGAGEYAEIVEIRRTSTGTVLELEVEPSVMGWATSWDRADSVWSLVLSASPREVTRLKMSEIEWREGFHIRPEGPIVVEIDHRTTRGSRSQRRYLERLGREAADELSKSLDVPVKVFNAAGRSTPTERVEAANSEGAALYVSLALDEYAGEFPHGITVAVPLISDGEEPLVEGEREGSPSQGTIEPTLLSWKEVAERHREEGRYFARLFAAARPKRVPVRLEERPLADLVGLDMPVIRLYIGRQSPTWDASASFPGDEEWDHIGGLARSLAQAARELFLVGRREEGLQ